MELNEVQITFLVDLLKGRQEYLELKLIENKISFNNDISVQLDIIDELLEIFKK